MTTNRNQALVKAKATVERRVGESDALLKALGIEPEAFKRITLNALVMNPKLGECTTDSLDLAVMHLAQSGLLPNGEEAAIVPFKKVATVIPMIEGQVKLLRQAVPGASVRARVVYDGDDWEYEEGLYPKLIHRVIPTASRKDDDVIAAYAIVRLPGQLEPDYEVFLRQDIDRARSFSRASSGPWFDHFPLMCMKSVLKRILKRLPKSANAPPAPPAQLANIDLGTVIDEQGRLVVDGMDVDPHSMRTVDPSMVEKEVAPEPVERERQERRPRPTQAQAQRPQPQPEPSRPLEEDESPF